MKKTLPILIVALCCAVFCNRTIAANGIAVRLLGYTIDSTLNVNIGYKLTISAEVTNTDTALFSATLDFGVRNLQQDLSATNVFNKPVYSSNQITLNPGETVPAIFSIDIDHPYFSPGPDVVVVWPICPNPIADSIRIPLNILDPNAIAEKKAEDFSYIVTPEKIILLNSGTEINFQQVRIYNLFGQQVSFFQSNFIQQIPVPALPRGIYLCELIDASAKRRTLKFFH